MNENDRLGDLSKKIGLQFPTSAKLENLRQGRSGPDGMLLAKVTLSAKDWKPFLATTPLANEPFSDEKRYLFGPDEDWWDPEQPKSLPTAQAQLPGAEVLNLGIDESDPERVVIYLMWHET